MFSESDFDRLRQIMEESPEKQELLQRLLDSHQMTISAISHEIRNPLTLIYSNLQLISSQHPDISGYKQWNQLMQDVEYTNSLLEELSAYNNSCRLNPSPIDASSFFRAIALSFAVSISNAGIEFTSRITPGLPEVHCDTVKMRQALLNLLQNARDGALQQDARKAKIRLEVFESGQCSHLPPSICVKVIDNGCGIPPEHMEHIFQPFVTYKSGGTGLGLAITERIARSHGGSLSASSVPGELTVFTLTFPIQNHG